MTLIVDNDAVEQVLRGLPTSTCPKRERRKRWTCPLPDAGQPDEPCHTRATYRHNLRKHLTGTRAYGGHELAAEDAERVLDELDTGA